MSRQARTALRVIESDPGVLGPGLGAGYVGQNIGSGFRVGGGASPAIVGAPLTAWPQPASEHGTHLFDYSTVIPAPSHPAPLERELGGLV